MFQDPLAGFCKQKSIRCIPNIGRKTTHNGRLSALRAISKDGRRQYPSVDGYRRRVNIHTKLAYIIALPIL
jgi:hypothetical protein